MSTFAVALDGRFSGTLQPTGTQTVAFNLFDAMVRAPRNVELVVFADPVFPGVADWEKFPGVRLVPIPFSRWNRWFAQLWVHAALPRAARRQGCRLVHYPMTVGAPRRAGIRRLVTVHDLNFLHHPEWFGRKFVLWLRATAVPAIRTADHVAAVSDYVLRDVRTTLGIAPENSSRIYNGVKFLPSAGSNAAASRRTILGVNLWQPHKNLLRLLRAVKQLRTEYPDLELHLAGRTQANFRRIQNLDVEINAPGVKLLGYLTDGELAAAYTTATLVAYPSLGEGFGLPVLEAMAAGAPVVTSNITSLPEVSGGAAILVDPHSETSIAGGLREALNQSPAQRSARIAEGKRIAARFSWDAAAQSYLKLYERLLRRP